MINSQLEQPHPRNARSSFQTISRGSMSQVYAVRSSVQSPVNFKLHHYPAGPTLPQWCNL